MICMIWLMLPGWEPYNLHDLGHVSWVGSVLYRSYTASHNRRMGYFSIFAPCFLGPSLLLSSSTRWRFFTLSGLLDTGVVTGVVPSPPRYVPLFLIAHRVQYSHCSSTVIECCQLTLSFIFYRAYRVQHSHCSSTVIKCCQLTLSFTFIAHGVQHSHCSSTVIECCQLVLSRLPLIIFFSIKSPVRTSMHSVRLEPTNLILLTAAGTRTTYQATVDNISVSGRYICR